MCRNVDIKGFRLQKIQWHSHIPHRIWTISASHTHVTQVNQPLNDTNYWQIPINITTHHKPIDIITIFTTTLFLQFPAHFKSTDTYTHTLPRNSWINCDCCLSVHCVKQQWVKQKSQWSEEWFQAALGKLTMSHEKHCQTETRFIPRQRQLWPM